MSHPEPTPQDDDQAPMFRKKPVEVEAMQWPKDGDNRFEAVCQRANIHRWVNDNGGETVVSLDRDTGDVYAAIVTLEGEMRIGSGDYVIRGTRGEFYPCKAAPFADTFEPVADPPPTLIESIAQWLGERESTHLWPEIHESDKACYRDAARDLIATVGGVGEFGVTKGLPGIRDRLIAAQQALVDAERNLMNARERSLRTGTASDLVAEHQALAESQEAWVKFHAATNVDSAAPGAASAALAANNWLTRMLENTNTVCVQLPEPTRVNERHGDTTWAVSGEDTVILDRFGVVTTYFQDTWDDENPPTPDDLRAGAAALLAAAAKIEAGE